MRELLCLGISHKTAPVSVRERVALLTRDAEALCAELVELPEVDEAVAISTCNRTEVYLAAERQPAETAVLQALADRGGDSEELRSAAFRLTGVDAARHLFQVTAGLDSMIVGESEIQGQVRRAYETAHAAGTTGPTTDDLFSSAVRAGRRVRSETGIGAGHSSVSSVAVALAADVVGDLPGRKVVIIGAGETAELTASALAGRGVSTIVVTNRHTHRARVIASRFGGEVAALHDLPEHLHDADIVVSSTASPHTLIEAGELTEIVTVRPSRPLVLIDLAVPRDIDPACAAIDGVSLYDMDDLQQSADETFLIREVERKAADRILGDELGRFTGRLELRDVTELVAELHRYGDGIVEHVLAENAGRWESASPRDLARGEALARSLMQRLLHEPAIRLRAAADDAPTAARHAEVLAELFGLAETVAPDEPGLADVLPLRRS